MVTDQTTDTSDRRSARLVAAVALCVVVATVTCAAAVAPATGASASTAGVGPSDDRPRGTTVADRGSDGARGTVSSGAVLAGSTRGQLFGVLLVLLVLAVIGVAAWGTRPGDFARFDRASSLRGWAPSGRVDETGDASADVSADGQLLTDEERIIELLEENGGRLKQQHVVETTDWSKAKVSRLLSSMEDEDAIVRIQLGREKLIFLSGHEPNGARSTLREDG